MIAVDTNLLVHAHRREASLHQAAYREIANLAQSSNPWAICYHSLIEFYAVVTQSRIWKTASTPAQAFAQIHAWQESPTLRILTDVETSLEQLESLAKAGNVQGPMIHDARIAACCLSHGVRELWTVDRDFSRFPDLKVRNPLTAKVFQMKRKGLLNKTHDLLPDNHSSRASSPAGVFNRGVW